MDIGKGIANGAMALTLWVLWLSSDLPAWALIAILVICGLVGRYFDCLIASLCQQRAIEGERRAVAQQIKMAELQREMEFRAWKVSKKK